MRPPPHPWLMLRLWRAAHVFELVDCVAVRVGRVVPYLKDAHRPIYDITILVELDVALHGIQVRRLDCIAYIVSIDRLSRGRHSLNSIKDDQCGVVGRYRVVDGRNAPR